MHRFFFLVLFKPLNQLKFSERFNFWNSFAVCRKCINKKFADEELENCPVCDIPLGAVPSEKLRQDPSANLIGFFLDFSHTMHIFHVIKLFHV